MLFGTRRDFNLIHRINRELLQDVVEQEILLYKIALAETIANIYGEASEKTYYTPVKLNCLIVRGDQVVDIPDISTPDLTRTASFAFLRRDFLDVQTILEVGDIIQWHEDLYEVDTVRENQLFLGRDDSYNLTDYGSRYGTSLSIIGDCHMTRGDKVGITRQRL